MSDEIVEEVIPRILAPSHNGATVNLIQNEESNVLLPGHQMDENGMSVQRDYEQQQFNGNRGDEGECDGSLHIPNPVTYAK